MSEAKLIEITLEEFQKKMDSAFRETISPWIGSPETKKKRNEEMCAMISRTFPTGKFCAVSNHLFGLVLTYPTSEVFWKSDENSGAGGFYVRCRGFAEALPLTLLKRFTQDFTDIEVDLMLLKGKKEEVK